MWWDLPVWVLHPYYVALPTERTGALIVSW